LPACELPFADDIVFEQIFITDAYDYSQFGNLSK
jgi:hypothetical protein